MRKLRPRKLSAKVCTIMRGTVLSQSFVTAQCFCPLPHKAGCRKSSGGKREVDLALPTIMQPDIQLKVCSCL